MKKLDIAFIGIGFYDYEDAIKQKLEEYGNNVFYFRDQPKYLERNYIRIILRIFGINLQRKIERYQINQINKIKNFKNNIDIVFIIKGDKISNKAISYLKKSFPKAKFKLYLWDAIKRCPNFNNIESYFDNIYSFDRLDCLNMPKLIFRPLFFRNEHTCSAISDYKYDIVFIGWIHFNRLNIIKNIKNAAEMHGVRCYFYLYIGIYSWIRLFLKGYSKNLHIRKIPYKRMIKVIDESKAILDIQHPQQSGLSMRCIEALGKRKIIVTNNKDIANYDIYNHNNIIINNYTDPTQCFDMFNDLKMKKYVNLPIELLYKYSLDAWVKEIFYN